MAAIGLTKATPASGSVEPIANGSLEYAACEMCETKIIRSTFGRPLVWWHVDSGRIPCHQGGKKK